MIALTFSRPLRCRPYCTWYKARLFVIIEDMQTQIRPARLEDLAVLLHHRRAMFEEMGFRDSETLDAVDIASREYFADALRTGSYVGWLAEELTQRRIVGGGGLVLARWPGYPCETLAKRAWILNMYTEPEARRQGIANQLLKAMITWCRNSGFGSVSLHASAAGRRLYERAGFKPTNEMRLNFR
jgi:GNAT superfamily N-acetyltransferase